MKCKFKLNKVQHQRNYPSLYEFVCMKCKRTVYISRNAFQQIVLGRRKRPVTRYVW